MRTFMLVAFAMFLVIGVVIFGNAMQATDYEASNQTGNNTVYTNQTIYAVGVNYAWWGGAAFLMLVIAVFFVFSKFVK